MDLKGSIEPSMGQFVLINIYVYYNLVFKLPYFGTSLSYIEPTS